MCGTLGLGGEVTVVNAQTDSRYDMLVCLFFFLIATDYIRTFTWDKKLEMVVKSTGILGGQGKCRMKAKLLIVFPFYLEASHNCATEATTSPPCRFATLDQVVQNSGRSNKFQKN